ncbi:hypothetical protein [Halobaculum sp. MBLA0143]|uniref:hypothetical protein n=1 Tax=Halobaculum sp. MBLA0143 TaxID=3079933 RepID=UPI003526BD8A
MEPDDDVCGRLREIEGVSFVGESVRIRSFSVVKVRAYDDIVAAIDCVECFGDSFGVAPVRVGFELGSDERLAVVLFCVVSSASVLTP